MTGTNTAWAGTGGASHFQPRLSASRMHMCAHAHTCQLRLTGWVGQTHWGFLSLMTKCVLTFPFLAELKLHAGFCAAPAGG